MTANKTNHTCSLDNNLYQTVMFYAVYLYKTPSQHYTITQHRYPTSGPKAPDNSLYDIFIVYNSDLGQFSCSCMFFFLSIYRMKEKKFCSVTQLKQQQNSHRNLLYGI